MNHTHHPLIARLSAWFDSGLPHLPATLPAERPPRSADVFFSLEFGDAPAAIDEAWVAAIASYENALRALVVTDEPGAWMRARACALELGRLHGSLDRRSA